MENVNTYKRLQYSPFDWLIILVGIFCILAGAYLFNNVSFMSSDFRETETFGYVSTGAGTRKLGNSLQWFDVDKKSELYYGDVIFANENKDIEIELKEDKDSKFIVPVDSMVKISRAGDEFNLDVSRGSVLINSNKKISKINIKDKRGRVRKLDLSKGAKLKITSKKSNVVVEAISGKASLVDNTQKEKLEVGKGKLLLVGRKKSEVVNKINIIATKSYDPLFENKIRLMPKFKDISKVEISSSENFTQIKTYPVKNGLIDLDFLRYGKYFLRLEKEGDYDSFVVAEKIDISIDAQTKESYYSGEKLRVTWNSLPQLSYEVEVVTENDSVKKIINSNKIDYKVEKAGPVEFIVKDLKYGRMAKKEILLNVSNRFNIMGLKEASSLTDRNRVFELKNPNRLSYNIELLNENGQKIIQEKSKKEAFQFKNLTPQKYTLNLYSADKKEKLYTQDFLIQGEILNRGTSKKVYSAAKKLSTEIKWLSTRKIDKQKYTLKLFEKGKTDPFFEKQLNENRYFYATSTEKEIEWQVVPESSELVAASKKYSLSLKRPRFKEVVAPKIILKYLEESNCHQFTIPKFRYGKFYDVYIYSSRTKVNGKWKLMYRKRLNQNKDCIDSKGEGKYFYRYRVENIWGKTSKFSPVGEIYFPISPLDEF